MDTAEDLQLLRQIYAHFNHQDDFTWLDVLTLFEREPALAQLNAAVRHKNFQESEGNVAQGNVAQSDVAK